VLNFGPRDQTEVKLGLKAKYVCGSYGEFIAMFIFGARNFHQTDQSDQTHLERKTGARNRSQKSGIDLWHRFLARVSWALRSSAPAFLLLDVFLVTVVKFFFAMKCVMK